MDTIIVVNITTKFVVFYLIHFMHVAYCLFISMILFFFDNNRMTKKLHFNLIRKNVQITSDSTNFMTKKKILHNIIK